MASLIYPSIEETFELKEFAVRIPNSYVGHQFNKALLAKGIEPRYDPDTSSAAVAYSSMTCAHLVMLFKDNTAFKIQEARDIIEIRMICKAYIRYIDELKKSITDRDGLRIADAHAKDVKRFILALDDADQTNAAATGRHTGHIKNAIERIRLKYRG